MPQVIVGPRCRELAELHGSYIERDMSLTNEPTKQQQRDRVLSHIRKFHSPDQKMRFAGLPGYWWAFEQQLCDSQLFHDPDFICFERNYEIMRHGTTFMPGRASKLHKILEPTALGMLRGYESLNAKILWLSGSLFMELRTSELATASQKKVWSQRYKLWTSAWWDFMCPINEESLACLRGTDFFAHWQSKVIPVSITLLGAREEPQITRAINALVPEQCEDRRVRFLERWYNAGDNSYFVFSVSEVFHYQSEGGAPMLLINAILTRRHNNRFHNDK